MLTLLALEPAHVTNSCAPTAKQLLAFRALRGCIINEILSFNSFFGTATLDFHWRAVSRSSTIGNLEYVDDDDIALKAGQARALKPNLITHVLGFALFWDKTVDFPLSLVRQNRIEETLSNYCSRSSSARVGLVCAKWRSFRVYCCHDGRGFQEYCPTEHFLKKNKNRCSRLKRNRRYNFRNKCWNWSLFNIQLTNNNKKLVQFWNEMLLLSSPQQIATEIGT